MKTNHLTDPAELPGATTGPQSMAAIYMRGEPAVATDFDTRPKCGVRGSIRPGAMCGSVIVGGTYCGHPGECHHKIIPSAV